MGRLGLVLMLVIVMVGAAALVQAVDVMALVRGAPTLDACGGSTTLRPIERPGPPWVEHRHWLETNVVFTRRGAYYIRNDQTGQLFNWPYLGNIDGEARFGVLTRWTWFNADWKSDTWTLFYEC
jgi:hypothetical protein